MHDGRYPHDRFLYMAKNNLAIPEGGNILDCGSGFNHDTIVIFGDKFNVVPSDIRLIAPTMPQMEHLDVNTFESETGLIDRIPLWDAIVLSEVLEHVENPQQVIQHCFNHLKPNGYIIITVPFLYRMHEDLINYNNESTPVYDYWRFTPRAVKLLCKSAGFGTTFASLYPHDYQEYECASVCAGFAIKDEPYAEIELWEPVLLDGWREQQAKDEEQYLSQLEGKND